METGVRVYMDTMTIPLVPLPEIVSVSGYGSMADTDSLSTTASGDTGEKEFKSEFAKQLEQTVAPPEDSSLASHLRLGDNGERGELQRARDEFSRVRAENMRLRWEIERQKQDEERYMRLQYEVETLTSRLHKMEANRQAYEDLTEQLGSYISMFSSQMSLSHVTQQPDHVSRSYSTLQHVPRHVSLDQGRTCSLPRSRHHYLDTSVDTSDGDMRHDNSHTERGFLSLPRHQARPRSRHQDRFRNRSRTLAGNNVRTMRKEITTSLPDEEHGAKTIEISSEAALSEMDKKKSSLGLFLTRVKIFLLKRKKYDIQTLV